MVSMDDDDATTSPMFAYLRQNLPDLLERAQTEGWKVAVPRASSVRGVPMSQALVESHMLRQTSMRDELATANGRIVLVMKDPATGAATLAAGKGFNPEGTRADVLSEDLWYGPDSDHGLQLVRISGPLDGAVVRPPSKKGGVGLPDVITLSEGAGAAGGGALARRSSAEDRANAELEWCASDRKCLDALTLSLGGSGSDASRAALSTLKRRTGEFHRGYVMARGFEAQTSDKLRGFAQEVAETAQSSRDAAGDDDAASANVCLRASLVHILNILQHKLWTQLKSLYARQDAIAASAAERIASGNFAGLGIAPEILDVDFGDAVAAFSRLATHESPVLKAHALVAVQGRISEALREGRRRNSTTVFGAAAPVHWDGAGLGGGALGMDDLLPLFIFVVCQARVPHLVTTFVFMKHFAYDFGPSAASREFLVSLVEAALKVLLTAQGRDG